MNQTQAFWVVIVSLGAGTFLLRSLPLWTHGRIPLPEWLRRLLRHVPAAALTALVVPGVLYTTHSGSYEFAPARAIAGLVALLAALKWRNMIVTLVAGMGTLWIMQAAFGM